MRYLIGWYLRSLWVVVVGIFGGSGYQYIWYPLFTVILFGLLLTPGSNLSFSYFPYVALTHVMLLVWGILTLLTWHCLKKDSMTSLYELYVLGDPCSDVE